jgi:hypothetical protein
MIMLVMLISWGFPLTVACYLYNLYKLVSSIKVEYEEYWKSIGSPSSTDPNGQVKILKLIFLPNALPAIIFSYYKVRIFAIRWLACLGIILFIGIILLAEFGEFGQLTR